MAHLPHKTIKKQKTLDPRNEELKIALDHIESGCLVYTSNETVHILIKESAEKIHPLIRPQDIKFIFTPLLKSEFPIITMLIHIKNDAHEAYKFQYDFLLDSEKDICAISTLIDNPLAVIQLFDGKNYFSFNVLLEDFERETLKSILQSSKIILTKDTL